MIKNIILPLALLATAQAAMAQADPELDDVPPDYIPNKHVFILRLADGTYAALQLANFISPEGKKCFLTINYKYPY